MKDFKDKVAVVTGGASGIGRAMAEKFASEGMKIVLADIQPDALAAAEKEMKAAGAKVIGVPTDVAKGDQIEALAKKALGEFGGVHVVCNNAGVAVAGPSWERTAADWEWVLGVNLWGVIHGIRVFVPIMLEQKTEAHIVNTASLAGLLSAPGMAIYSVTKFGVVTLSESLYHELRMRNAKIGVSVLCPGWVQTKIVDSDRNRPAELANKGEAKQGPEVQMLEQMVRQLVGKGLSPADAAQKVFEAVRDGKFYIFTHPEMMPLVETRMQEILQAKNPTYRPMV